MLRLSDILELVWSLFRFLFNDFVQPFSSFQLRPAQNLRAVSLRQSELRTGLRRVFSGLSQPQRVELQELLSALVSESGDLIHAVSESQQLMTVIADTSDVLLTGGPGQQAVQTGPSAVIRHVGDSLLAGLGCLLSSVAGKWTPSSRSEPPASPPTPTPPAPASQPTCETLEQAAEAVLDNMPVFAEMLYKIGLKFTDAFRVQPQSRGAGATPRLDTAVTPAGVRLDVRRVAGSTGRFRPPLTTAEGVPLPAGRTSLTSRGRSCREATD